MIHDNADTGGEVEAADMGIDHRNGQAIIGVGIKETFGEARGFFAEKKYIATLGLNGGVGAFDFGG